MPGAGRPKILWDMSERERSTLSPLPPCGSGAGSEGLLPSPALGAGLGVRVSPLLLWERGWG